MTSIRFQTKLVTIKGWLIVHVPPEASRQLPSRGQVMAKGTINDVPLLTALEPDGTFQGHWFRVDATLQKRLGVAEGDTVSLEIEATNDWPEPEVPTDWQAALDADAEVRQLWQRITPLARWEWLRWINSTREPATRARRIEVSCSKLRAGSRRPCCFNRSMCCVPEVSKNGVLLDPLA